MEVDEILKGKYPAKAHAKKVYEYLSKHGHPSNSFFYLEGQKTRMIEDNDGEAPFRQRRYFFYLTGCDLPDCALSYDAEKEHLTLFIPPIDPDAVLWAGLPVSPAEALERYDVDAVLPTTKIETSLTAIASTKASIFAIRDQMDLLPSSLLSAATDFDLTDIKAAIEECRVRKDAYEVALTRRANAITSAAHTAVLRAARTATNERDLHALFLATCMREGAPHQAYGAIVASGRSAATLHYVHNNASLTGAHNLLLDAAAETRCYAADVTRTFPISGTWDPQSRSIYDLVLQMQSECLQGLHAGVLWDELHALAHRIAIAGLLRLGVLHGGSAEEIFAARTSVAFFPHGLGHYLGLDTHDTGGNADYGDKDSMFRYLRVRGPVPAGAIITVEPGVYFCRFIVEPYLQDPVHAKYIDSAVLDQYWDVGGVRIEDDVLVTKDGYENLTTAVKDAEQMCRIIRGEA